MVVRNRHCTPGSLVRHGLSKTQQRGMSVEKEVPPLPECLGWLSAQGEAETEVAAVVRAIENQAAEAVRDLALAELDLPAGAAAVTAKLVPLLQWSRLSYDQADEKSLSGGWNRAEPEPIPPSIDSWARGAIPSKPDPSVSDTPLSSSRRDDQEGAGEEEEEGRRNTSQESSSATMPAINSDAERDRRKDKSPVDAPVKNGGTNRRTSDRSKGASPDDNDEDGRAWGLKDGDGGEIGPLSALGDGSQPGGEETLAGAGGIGDAIGRGRRQEERAFLEGLRRREEARTREQTETRERLERADKENKETEERMKKELKGRDWVWGPNGEILVLDVVPPDKIPVRVMPRVGVRDCPAQPIGGGSSSTVGTDAAPTPRGRPRGRLRSVQTGSDGNNGGESVPLRGDQDGLGKGEGGLQDDKNSIGGGGGGDGGEGQRRGKPGADASGGRSGKASSKGGAAARRRKGSRSKRFFEMSATSQPPLLDSLDLQAGVCVKEGSQEKQGPPFEEDRNHMPRRGVRSREPMSREPSLTLALGSEKVGTATDFLSREGQSLDPPRNRGGIQGDPLSPPATFPLRSASIPAERGDNEYPSSGRNRLVDGVKTLDPLSGATRLEPSGIGAGPRGRGGGGYHRGRRLPGPEGAEQEGFTVGDDPEDDPHWRLFKEGGNVSGGATGLKPVPPPALPRKRGPRQKRGVLTKPEPRRPRDRGTRLPISTVARKHLPPPPVGETMGHGLSPPQDRGPARAKVRGQDDGDWLSSPGRAPARGRNNNNNDDDYNSAQGRSSIKSFVRDDAAAELATPRGVGRKRASGGGGVNEPSGPRKRGGAGGGRGSGKGFPVLPGLKEAYLLSPPRGERGGGMQHDEGIDRMRKGAMRGSAQRMGWINARPSQGTLQELLRAA